MRGLATAIRPRSNTSVLDGDDVRAAASVRFGQECRFTTLLPHLQKRPTLGRTSQLERLQPVVRCPRASSSRHPAASVARRCSRRRRRAASSGMTSTRLAVEESARSPYPPSAARRRDRLLDGGDGSGCIRDRVNRIVRREEVRRNIVD
jgi:hypothetical protein